MCLPIYCKSLLLRKVFVVLLAYFTVLQFHHLCQEIQVTGPSRHQLVEHVSFLNSDLPVKKETIRSINLNMTKRLCYLSFDLLYFSLHLLVMLITSVILPKHRFRIFIEFRKKLSLFGSDQLFTVGGLKRLIQLHSFRAGHS
jgi:hypothetical protein